MHCDTQLDGAILVVTPRVKRLDADMAPAFRATLAELIAAGHRHLLVNLENVEFIDSPGLGVLVSTLRRIDGDGELTVCALCDPVRSMFELTRLNRVVAIVDAPGGAGR